MREFMGYKIHEFKSLESTNSYLFELAKNGEADKTVIIARSQRSGRGRQGKSFFSPDGTGLYMSVLLRKAISLDRLNYLTPMIAVAVAHSIERISKKTCGIKWVNDIYIGNKKVAGILVETKCDFEKAELDYAVIGIGVNIVEPKGGFPCDIAERAGAILGEANEHTITLLAQEILLDLDAVLNPYQPDRFMTEYKARSILDGRQITLATPSGEMEATAIGIDDDGCLVIETSSGRQAISSGDVSIKTIR